MFKNNQGGEGRKKKKNACNICLLNFELTICLPHGLRFSKGHPFGKMEHDIRKFKLLVTRTGKGIVLRENSFSQREISLGQIERRKTKL